MKYPVRILPFILSVLLSQVPADYKLSVNNTLNRYENITEDGLNSNSIVDIRPIDESYLLLGTASGLSYVHIYDLHPDSVSFGSFNRDSLFLQEAGSLPRGGSPALVVKDSVVALSGLLDTIAVTGAEQMGTGISYSIDEGETWEYLPQPIDSISNIWHCPFSENPQDEWYVGAGMDEGEATEDPPDECSQGCYDYKDQPAECKKMYQWIEWGEQDSILSLLVTTEIMNISYDLAIGENYIYAASWAGGLRRYGPLYSGQESWQIIPLPMDPDSSLMCGVVDLNSYEINPKDPWDGNSKYISGMYGSHNQKGFSVYVIDNTIWAGTAMGINKGIIDNDCINWQYHFTANGTVTPRLDDELNTEYIPIGIYENISGNWVIGFTHQELSSSTTRLWAITWAGEGNSETHALSYTDDDGESWQITYPSGGSEKVYNLYANESRIWAASASGLYVSEDGKHWEKYSRPIDVLTGKEILSESVLAVYYKNNWLWQGTIDGIGIIEENEMTTTIHRFWEPANPFSAYPNPFLINDYNQVGNDGYMRFSFSNPDNYIGTIDVFDFAMDQVIHLDISNPVAPDENEIIWNGRNAYGDKVANGVYFCRLTLSGEHYWTKLAVIN